MPPPPERGRAARSRSNLILRQQFAFPGRFPQRDGITFANINHRTSWE